MKVDYMKIWGHAAGGYITSKIIIKGLNCSSSEKKNLMLLGTFAGIMPDLDFIFHIIKKRTISFGDDFRHHTWITHTFPFYWLISGIIFLIGVFREKETIKNNAKVIAASTTVHLLQDMVGSGDGIMVCFPFSRKMSGIGLLNVHGKKWETTYSRSPIYLVELIIDAIAISSICKDLLVKRNSR
jgi:membrane-bound metal-dependent hydrolase YbcI (DUF457 family)